MGDAVEVGRPADRQRLAFGQVAELYDRARPAYPPAAVDAVIELAELTHGSPIFEVGAGTGKATRLLAERGLRIVAIEPDPAMARLARANCAALHSDVEIVVSDFERWRAPERRPAVVSAQAWHWISPEVGYRRAYEALSDGGRLVAMWTVPDWQRCAPRGAFAEVYRATVPDMAPDFPMHPDNQSSSLAVDWPAAIAATEWFTAPLVREVPWSQEYTASAYRELVATHQDHILLADPGRSAVLAGVASVIDEAGGTFSMPYLTRVCAAVRADRPANPRPREEQSWIS
jgi:protein-L-isoaspartate O-methyltransferase